MPDEKKCNNIQVLANNTGKGFVGLFYFCLFLTRNILTMVSPMAQRVKNPCNAGDTGDSCLILGEDPLEKEMATHSSILAWETPWTKKPGRLQSMWSQRVRHDWVTKYTLMISCMKVCIIILNDQESQKKKLSPKSYLIYLEFILASGAFSHI